MVVVAGAGKVEDVGGGGGAGGGDGGGGGGGGDGGPAGGGGEAGLSDAPDPQLATASTQSSAANVRFVLTTLSPFGLSPGCFKEHPQCMFSMQVIQGMQPSAAVRRRHILQRLAKLDTAPLFEP